MTVAVTRLDLSARDLRASAARSTDAKAARRMLAIALVMEGSDRAAAARSCGMDRQTLRDWARVASITGQARSTLTRENGQPTDSNLAQPSSVILLRARTPICASVF